MALTDDTTGLHFRWRGGAYIEVHPCEDAEAADCINVYDYERGTPAIPATLDAFQEACHEWLRGQEEL